MSDIKAILHERGERYGTFVGHATISQSLKQVMFSVGKELDNDQAEALEMIAHKIARILNGNPDTHDHWHDIAGYATLVANDLE